MPSARVMAHGTLWIGLVVALLGVLSATLAAAAGGSPQPQEPEEPRGPPLGLRLTAVQSIYHLRDGRKLKKQIEKAIQADAAANASPAFPEPPTVDLALEVTNRSKDPIQIWSRGANFGVATVYLEGPGAMTVSPHRRSPARVEKHILIDIDDNAPEELAPGQVYTVPIDRLTSAGGVTRCYWTSPGDYRVTVSWTIAVNPAPPASKRAENGFGLITLTSDPTTLEVKSP